MSEEVERTQGTEEAPKEKKSPNTFVILFFVTCAIAVLSWIVPGGAYELDEAGHAIAGTYHQVEANPQGLWDVAVAPIIGMVGSETTAAAISISLSIMIFGSFLEMMDRTGAIRAFLGKITGDTTRGTHALIAILTIIMAFFGTLEGCYEEDIVYFLMFVPAILSLGMDTVVAVMIVVLGSQVGCLASTINPFSVGIASGIAGVSSGDGLLLRTLMLVGLTALVIVIICRYADKVVADPTVSTQYARREADLEEFVGGSASEATEITKEQRGALVCFVLTFAFMILGLIPYTSINESWTFFEDLAAGIAQVPVLGVLVGHLTPFGDWYFNEITLVVLVMTIIIGALNHYDIDTIIDTVISGAAGLVSTAFVVPMARGIQVVMDAGQITPTILHLGETTLSALPPMVFVVVSLLFYLAIACLIPSSTGLSAATMAIMSTLARFASVPASLMVTIMCMALGMAKMFTPTSIAVMTVTSAAHMSYTDWLKKVMPIVGVIFVCCCGFLFLGLALG